MFPGWIFLDVNSQLFSLQVQSWQEKLRETEKAHSALREQSVFPSVRTRILGYGKLVYLWASTKSPQTRSFSMATSMCCKWVCSYVQPDKMINSQLHSKQPDNKMLRQKLLDLCSRCVWQRSFIKAAPTHGSKRKRKKWVQISIHSLHLLRLLHVSSRQTETTCSLCFCRGSPHHLYTPELFFFFFTQKQSRNREKSSYSLIKIGLSFLSDFFFSTVKANFFLLPPLSFPSTVALLQCLLHIQSCVFGLISCNNKHGGGGISGLHIRFLFKLWLSVKQHVGVDTDKHFSDW